MPDLSLDLRTAERDHQLAQHNRTYLAYAHRVLQAKILAAQDVWNANVMRFECSQMLVETSHEICSSLNARKPDDSLLEHPAASEATMSGDVQISQAKHQLQAIVNAAARAMRSEYRSGTRDMETLKKLAREAAFAEKHSFDESSTALAPSEKQDATVTDMHTGPEFNAQQWYATQLGKQVSAATKQLKKIAPILGSLDMRYTLSQLELLDAQRAELSAQAELDAVTAQFQAYGLNPDGAAVVGVDHDIPGQQQDWPADEISVDEFITAVGSDRDAAEESDSDWHDLLDTTPAAAVGVDIREDACSPA